MTIKQFIEKAKEGGWTYPIEQSFYSVGDAYRKANYRDVNISSILLDPLAWQAVGKVEGKGVFCGNCESYVPVFGECKCDDPEVEEWHVGMMHRMVDALCEGGTLESFIATL